MTIPTPVEPSTPSNPQPTQIVISPLFSINQTSYGGRACFADESIPSGTNVLKTNTPLGSVILYEFRKEVCANCFRYKYGEMCKVKLNANDLKHHKKKKFLGAGLWFCSEDCKESYLQRDGVEELIMVYESLLEQYQIKAKHPIEHPDDFKPEVTREYIESFWSGINEWDDKSKKTKKTKLLNQLPYINEDEYTTARFATLALFNLHKSHKSVDYYHDLQSNEFEKVSKFPILLLSQANVFKFLRIVLPDYLQPLLTTLSFRLLCGREYGNSFGIWQIIDSPEHADENKEFLGYSLYAEASYFNHSCSPNVRKFRVNDKMHFETIKDAKEGEQLCIDYFHILNENRNERQKVLKQNWFFECGCDRCQAEK